MKQVSLKSIASFKAEYYSYSGDVTGNVPTRRDFYKIWLIKDSGVLKYGEQTMAIDQPTLVFLHPLVPYSFSPLTKIRSGYWCIFTGDFLSGSGSLKLLQETNLFPIKNPQIRVLAHDTLNDVLLLFEKILENFQSSYTFQREILQNLVGLLIHEGLKLYVEASPHRPQNAGARLTNRFLNLLEKQFPLTSTRDVVKQKKPADFASELAVHINHLNAVVQQMTGKSTTTHISERLIAESKALLHYSDWTIGEIAYSMGFDYPNHFTTFFKKYTGKTPLSFRKQIL